jgi:hypothetical protein
MVITGVDVLLHHRQCRLLRAIPLDSGLVFLFSLLYTITSFVIYQSFACQIRAVFLEPVYEFVNSPCNLHHSQCAPLNFISSCLHVSFSHYFFRSSAVRWLFFPFSFSSFATAPELHAHASDAGFYRPFLFSLALVSCTLLGFIQNSLTQIHHTRVLSSRTNQRIRFTIRRGWEMVPLAEETH